MKDDLVPPPLAFTGVCKWLLSTEREFLCSGICRRGTRKFSMLTGTAWRVQSLETTNIPRGASSSPGIFFSYFLFNLVFHMFADHHHL